MDMLCYAAAAVHLLVSAVGIALQIKFPMYGRSLRLW
jgi:hypothetical protein